MTRDEFAVELSSKLSSVLSDKITEPIIIKMRDQIKGNPSDCDVYMYGNDEFFYDSGESYDYEAEPDRVVVLLVSKPICRPDNTLRCYTVISEDFVSDDGVAMCLQLLSTAFNYYVDEWMEENGNNTED